MICGPRLIDVRNAGRLGEKKKRNQIDPQRLFSMGGILKRRRYNAVRAFGGMVRGPG
jgi:hypothetical protein